MSRGLCRIVLGCVRDSDRAGLVRDPNIGTCHFTGTVCLPGGQGRRHCFVEVSVMKGYRYPGLLWPRLDAV